MVALLFLAGLLAAGAGAGAQEAAAGVQAGLQGGLQVGGSLDSAAKAEPPFSAPSSQTSAITSGADAVAALGVAPAPPVSVGGAASGGVVTSVETHKVELSPPVSVVGTSSSLGGSGGASSMTSLGTHKAELAPPVSVVEPSSSLGGSGGASSDTVMTSIETHKAEPAPPVSLTQTSSPIGGSGSTSFDSDMTSIDQKMVLAPPASVSQSSVAHETSGGSASSGEITTSVETHKAELAPPATAARPIATSESSSTSLGPEALAPPAGATSHEASASESSSDVASSMGSSTSTLFPGPSSPTALYILYRKVPYFLPLAYREAYPYLAQAQHPFGFGYPVNEVGVQSAADLYRYLSLLSYPYRTISLGFYPRATPYRSPALYQSSSLYQTAGPYQSLYQRPDAGYDSRKYFVYAVDRPLVALGPGVSAAQASQSKYSQDALAYQASLHHGDLLNAQTHAPAYTVFAAPPPFPPADLSDRYVIDDPFTRFQDAYPVPAAKAVDVARHPLAEDGPDAREPARRNPLAQQRPTLEVHTPSGLHLPLTANSDFVLHKK